MVNTVARERITAGGWRDIWGYPDADSWPDDERMTSLAVGLRPVDTCLIGGGKRFGLLQSHLFAATLQASWSGLCTKHLGATDFTLIPTP
jgi:hypothetical protein